MRCEGPRPKRLVSLLGAVSLQRPYYHCRHCWRGAAPLDRELDIEGTQYSPAVRRLLAVVGGETPFARGRALLEDWRALREVSRRSSGRPKRSAATWRRGLSRTLPGGLRGSRRSRASRLPRSTSRWNGTGIPVTAAASAGRQGKQAAGADTRGQAGLRLHAAGLDAEGRPVRARTRLRTRARLRTPRRSGRASTTRHGSAACTAPTARSCSVTARPGSGI